MIELLMKNTEMHVDDISSEVADDYAPPPFTSSGASNSDDVAAAAAAMSKGGPSSTTTSSKKALLPTLMSIPISGVGATFSDFGRRFHPIRYLRFLRQSLLLLEHLLELGLSPRRY